MNERHALTYTAGALRAQANDIRARDNGRSVNDLIAAAILDDCAEHVDTTRLDDARLDARQLRIVAAELAFAYLEGVNDYSRSNDAQRLTIREGWARATGGR